MRRSLSLLPLALVIALLAGCGNKGPLVPPARPTPAASAPAPAVPAAATSSAMPTTGQP